MSVIRVALLQMTACGNDQSANQSKGAEYCRRAAAMGADIALFPEMWNIGYTLCNPSQQEKREAWATQAVDRDSDFIRHFQVQAREHNIAIAITYLEKWEGRPRNTVSLIDRRGDIILTYAKVHTCEFDAEALLTAGHSFDVAELHTANGAVKIGFMICYDREFPESARILMLNGTELILTPNACTLEAGRLGQFRARAFENMVGVAMTNYATPQNNGHSVAYDAVSYAEPDGEPRDTLLIEAGEREGIYIAEFDMTSIRAYRERETWGNAYRRPRCYGALTADEVHPPFLRPDATR